MRKTILMFLLMVCSTPALSQRPTDLGWRNYLNPQFGVQLRYPALVFSSRRSSEARDGDLFATSDNSAKILVGAFENADRHSPSSYQQFIARRSYPGLRVDYAPVGQSWSVLSGTRGNMTVYEKVMFSCGGRVISSFAIVYPTSSAISMTPSLKRSRVASGREREPAVSMPRHSDVRCVLREQSGRIGGGCLRFAQFPSSSGLSMEKSWRSRRSSCARRHRR